MKQANDFSHTDCRTESRDQTQIRTPIGKDENIARICMAGCAGTLANRLMCKTPLPV